MDGSLNFSLNLPIYAISVSLSYEEDLLFGVVYLPELKRMYSALIDDGAYLNNKKLKKNKSKNKVFETNYPVSNKKDTLNYFKKVLSNMVLHKNIRHHGCTSFALCMLAKGSIQKFYERNLKLWDFAAATLIAREMSTKVIYKKIGLGEYELYAENE